MAASIADECSVDGKYDVLIAGAGPAGCSAAMNIPKDMRVLLIDMQSSPRRKPCGGVLLERTRAFIKERNLSPPDDVFASPKEIGMKIKDIDNGLEIDMKRRFLNVRRDAFDDWILSMCADNVSYLPSARLVKHDRTISAFESRIATPSGRVTSRSDYLIDSTGASSFSHAMKGHPRPVLVAYQEWIKGDCDDYFGTIFHNSVTDSYVWTIPKDGHVVVGTGVLPQNIREKIPRFRRFIRNELGFSSKPSKIEGGILPSGKVSEVKLSTGDAIHAGESAGFVSASSGEGISFALRSGLFSAESIARFPQEPIAHYEELCMPLLAEMKKTERIAAAYTDPEARVGLFKRMSE